ncbi:hypothetical protein SGFS_048090 [Streptomyces graminofaciens]|uniref:Lipoprotein n=1 Tax=Streptomyces graminofaciens TaxID=68212 RepID=A0ABM9SBY2_9ACTN|nr:hypothetical protein [Streptomyces graminofaciens]BBC33515.1 hypothetical protein SGFS_048090 [Streptomyces graminofaciens]
MHKLKRHALLSAMSAITVAALLTTGCSATSQTPTDAAGAAVAKTPEPGAAEEQLAVVSAPKTGATPTAVADADANGAGQAKKSSLKVASYDKKSGRAVIAAPARASESSSPTPSASASTPAAPPVAVGDVIASAPAPGAPDGLLAKVTEVVGEANTDADANASADADNDGGAAAATTVQTEPATLDAVLGESKAEGEVPVDPSTIDVDPLVNGVKVSWAKTGDLTFGPKGAKLPLGSLRIDVGASVATAEDAPASAAASVQGFVQLAPEVAFSYDGTAKANGSSPGGAFLGLTGDWASKWSLKGRAAGTTNGKPIRIPFAELHSDPVIQAGPIPIVVNLDLTLYFQIDADGRVTVDVEQDLKGDFRAGGEFTWAKGWTSVSESKMTGEPLKTKVTATGKVKAALGAEATVGLYGTVGVTADLAPYLRVEADASAEGSADGTGSAQGSYALFGGVDLTGTLNLSLSIFGTPIFEKRIPLGAVHEEWLLTKGEVATA